MSVGRRGRTYKPQNVQPKIPVKQNDEIEVEIVNNGYVKHTIDPEIFQDEEVSSEDAIEIDVPTDLSPDIRDDFPDMEVKLENFNKPTDEDIEIEELSKQIQRDIQEELQKERETLPEVVISKTLDMSNYEYPKNEKPKVEEKQEKKVPHYIFQRNNETGKLEIIGSNPKREEEVKMKEYKNQTAQSLLEIVEKDIVKAELEIEIHNEIQKHLIDTNDIANTQRKIDTFNSNLNYLKQRKDALVKIIRGQ